MSRGRRRRNRNDKSFVMIPRKTLRSDAWKELSTAAKLFYIHLKGKYNGHNNGEIRLYYSELKGNKGISSPTTISNASKELENKEWLRRKVIGGLYRHFNEYELTGKYDDYL